MRFISQIAAFLIAVACNAQDNSKSIEAVYPPLARQARIQGDVRLSSGPEGVKVISGHPLLIPPALDSLKKLTNVWTTQTDIIYHFVLVDPGTRVVRETVKRGDAFDRLFLRLFRMKTEKVIERSECVQSSPPNRIEMNRHPVEVWVYGSYGCLQTDVTQVASR